MSISSLIKEGESTMREIYKKLIESYETSSQLGESGTRKKLVSNAVFYARSPKTYKVLLEQVKLNSSDPYLNGHVAQVIPVPYDRLHRILRNPFLGAEKDRVLRTNNGIEGSSSIVQLVPPANATIESYLTQIIRKPYPIIISDLSVLYPTDPLSIYGETLPYSATEATDISEIVHDEIIETAVKMAILHFRENSLSNNLQMQ